MSRKRPHPPSPREDDREVWQAVIRGFVKIIIVIIDVVAGGSR